MSLIACTLNYGVPVIIGDLLISSAETVGEIVLPTSHLDQELLDDNPYKPIALNQKVYIPHRNLCVALAGNVGEMEEFLRELKTRCKYFENIKEEHLQQFFSDIDLGVNFTKVAFFMLYVEEHANDQKMIKYLSYPKDIWSYENSEAFQAAHACGSGKKQFLYQITERAYVESSTSNGDIMHTVATNISLMTRLLAIETVTPAHVLKNWGGGYEMAIYNRDRFEKLSEYAIVVNLCKFDENGQLPYPAPQYILYYRYHLGRLVITSIEIKGGTGTENGEFITLTSQNIQVRIFEALSIDKQELIEEEYPNDYSFLTKRVSFGYAVFKEKSNPIYPSSFMEGQGVTVTFKQGEFAEIKIPLELHIKIATGTAKMYPTL